MAKLRLKTGSILGTFGKGVDGSLSINFSVSGADNCDDRCVHKGSTCYAERIEKRPDRAQLAAKLARHGSMPAWQVCGRAIVEINALLAQGKTIPWLRVSTAGSLPQPEVVRGNKLFASQFRALLQLCATHGIPIHIPVETYDKARFYRALAGSLAVIRESAQNAERFLVATGQVSTVAGTREHSMLERVDVARDLARERYETTGRKTIVCPAVVAGFRAKLKTHAPNDKTKCGNCTACSRADTDIVYPLH